MTTTAAFLVALTAGTLVPAINFWGLLLILLTTPVEALITRRWKRREAEGHVVGV